MAVVERAVSTLVHICHGKEHAENTFHKMRNITLSRYHFSTCVLELLQSMGLLFVHPLRRIFSLLSLDFSSTTNENTLTDQHYYNIYMNTQCFNTPLV